MAKEKRETGEQKLLRLIEEQGGGDAKGAGDTSGGEPSQEAEQVAQSVKGLGLPAISLPPILEPLLNMFKAKPSSGPPTLASGLRAANKILLVVVVMFCIVFLFNIFTGLRSTKKEITLDVEGKVAKSTSGMIPLAPAIDFYLLNFKQRNLFQPYEKKAVTQDLEMPEEKKRIVSLTENLRLVGVSWLDSPDTASAMIEDTQMQITRFLKVGDTINELTVTKIYANQVVLTYNGEEITLRL